MVALACHINDPYAARPWLASYPEGTVKDIDEASYSTLVDMFNRSVTEFGDRRAFESFGVTFSYRELERAAVNIASWLQ